MRRAAASAPGGDVVMLARSGAAMREDAKQFFFSEYRLNHLLFTYPKPTVAIMDGITMGGGVGISMPVRISRRDRGDALRHAGDGHRPVPGRRRRLVPSRLPGRVGEFMALTGARLDARNASTRPCNALRRAGLPPGHA